MGQSAVHIAGSLRAAPEAMRMLERLGGNGGLIALDRRGGLAMPFNSEGMYRGWIARGHAAQTAIFA